MSKEIAKSPEVLEKELLITKLHAQLNKRKRILKGLKTRLENTKKDIIEIQRGGSGQIISRMSQMDKIRLELVDLVKQMSKIKGLSRADKSALKDMEREFSNEDMFGEDFKAFKEQMAEREGFEFEGQFGENERAKMRDVFEAFAIKPSKEEQKDIRKIFIRLSQKFHPDKAPTKADEAEYHQMMQKINEAYQAGDSQTLLELEYLFLNENLDLSGVRSLTVDVLEQEIDQLNRYLQFIENQINRNSSELKNLRASDLGKMLTDIKKAEKEGVGMEATLAQLDDSIERLKRMKAAFSESISVGNISPLNEMLMAESTHKPSQQEMMAMVSDMMNGDMDPADLEAMFGLENDEEDDFGFFGFEEEEVKNAEFKEGMSVKIAKNVYDEDTGIALGKLIGRVVDIFYGDDNAIFYSIELDSISIDQLPPSFVNQAIEEGIDFQIFDILEKDLKKCQSRDSVEDAQGAYRTLTHQNLWNHLNADEQKRMQVILLQDSSLTDLENWLIYLEKFLKLPLEVKSKGLMEFKKGDKMKIVAIEGISDDHGIIVTSVYRKQRGMYPLFDLKGAGKDTKSTQILADYSNWAESILDIYF